MLFNSYEFLLFLPCVVVLYYLLPFRFRWMLLLVASYLFYASWDVRYLLLILTTTFSTYFTGRMMARLPDKRNRKPWLWLALTVNLGLLFYFKYTGFALDTAAWFSSLVGLRYVAPELGILLPIGISFYTFQSLSYSLDLYYGRIDPEPRLGIFALYVAYFPQLVMGPIERSGNLLPQLKERHALHYEDFVQGLCKIAYGFFKKLVVADRLKAYVDEVHLPGITGVDGPMAVDGSAALISGWFFALQMYCDFSGYSDIAIGSARLMGVRLMENFRRPFFAKNISDLWVRWHISLTTWFMDYVFVPMGSYSRGMLRTAFNLIVVAMITGIWHGPNWTWVIAFGFMGLLMVLRLLWIGSLLPFLKGQGVNWLPSLNPWLRVVLLFNAFAFAATYVRAGSVANAHLLLGKIVAVGNWIPTVQNVVLKNGQFEFAMCLLSLLLLFGSYLLPFNLRLGKYSFLFIAACFVLIYFLGVDQSTTFYYFQF